MAQKNWDAFIDQNADTLIQSVEPKFKPIFNGFTPKQQRAIYRYQFPRMPNKLPPSLKSRVINFYDPMANRSNKFQDGLRWCANIYVGCYHNCGYCYVNGYSQNNVGISPHTKKNFKKCALKDIMDIKAFGVPDAPLHISNSTDPLQAGLEDEHRHTLFMLQQVLANRELFTSIVILTKNPVILLTDDYLPIITKPRMRPLTVQVSCAFWDDKARAFYEPAAPTVNSRLNAMKILAGKGVDVELRIDPLFPASRIDQSIRIHKPLPEYGLPEAQTTEGIQALVKFASVAGTSSIIAKPFEGADFKQSETLQRLV